MIKEIFIHMNCQPKGPFLWQKQKNSGKPWSPAEGKQLAKENITRVTGLKLERTLAVVQAMAGQKVFP